MTVGRSEPSIGDVSPVAPVGVNKEPMLLVDTTGSMMYENERGSGVARKDVLGEAMGIIVGRAAAEDSQAAGEKERGEGAGGLMTVTFAKGTDYSESAPSYTASTGETSPRNGKIGDLSPENWREKWNQIQWGNGTEIMPGWNALNEVYLDEFGDTPQLDRPKMLALVITDGEADDTEQFAETLEKVGKTAYVVIAVMGYGQEHDEALERYRQVAEKNDHVRVVSFGNSSDPNTIADAILSLAA